MTSLALAAALQTSLLTAGFDTYAQAHQQTAQTGKPLVVLVGADWCPACRQVKQSSLPQVVKTGGLDQVAFAFVDADTERMLAKQLITGGGIPQLIMYYQTPSGWAQEIMVGAKSPEQIKSFISRGLKNNVAGKPSTRTVAGE